MNTSYHGLSATEVQERVARGEDNRQLNNSQQEWKKILKRNLFNYFNFINFLLGFVVYLTGSYRNLLFLGTVICNSCIGLQQEIKAYRQLQRLRLLAENKILLRRGGKDEYHNKEEMVLDDLFWVQRGDQLPVDALLLEGELWVDQAQLSGEQDSLAKEAGDKLFSGSSVTAGKALCQVCAIAQQSYINKMQNEVKQVKQHPSALRDGLNVLLKYIGFALIPLAAILLYKQRFLPLDKALLQTSASLVGMIPQGLFLLTSVALSLGSLRLAKENTLVQENYSLETLARCQLLCLDKTGTLTTGRVHCEKIISQNGVTLAELASYLLAQQDSSPASKAILQMTGTSTPMVFLTSTPFSSEKKKSSGQTQQDSYELGAYDFLDMPRDRTLEAKIRFYTSQGKRVMVFAKNHVWQNIIVLSDELRLHVKDTLDYLRTQNVSLVFLSGDDAETVASLLQQIDGHIVKSLNASGLTEKEFLTACQKVSVIGRASPTQKKAYIQQQQKTGKIVGMIGDGINDLLALRQADFSVALADGADASKKLANVVLLDNDFGHLPDIIAEGRKVINNIRRSATLFLSKTALAFFLTVFAIVCLPSYPFTPIQFTLLATSCIGIPSFLFTLEPSYEALHSHFFDRLLQESVLYGLMMASLSLAVFYFFPSYYSFLLHIYFLYYLGIYIRLAVPFTFIRKLGLGFILILFGSGSYFFAPLFNLAIPSFHEFLFILLLSCIGFILTQVILHFWSSRFIKKKR